MEQTTMFDDFKLDYRTHKKFRNGTFLTKQELTQKLRAEGKKKIYHILSFGGGTQSSHLLDQHLKGLIHYDYIIFSDTGAEPEFIHDQVAWWQHRQQEVGNTTPFIITHHNSMQRGLEEMLMRYILTDYQRFQMPIYCNSIDEETGEIKPAGIMPRQCTVDFKIIPVKQAARKLVMESIGLAPGQKMPGDIAFITDIGFSVDEIKRINTYQSPQFKYMYMAYPLVEMNMTTQESIKHLMENDYPLKRSRCYLCPFNCDDSSIGMDWMEIIESEPISFLKACWFDDQLRSVQASGSKIMRSIPYLHYSRRPLREVYEDHFNQLSIQYSQELSEWIDEWASHIKEKYGKELNNDATT